MIIKKLFIIIVIFFTINSTSFAGNWGKGELKLSKGTMQHLMMYMYGAGSPKYDNDKSKHSPTIFIVSEDGNWSYYSYCPYTRCEPPNQPQLIKLCEKGSNGSPCYVMALERRIVWKNGNKKIRIKKKMLKDPISVATAIKNAGFYDGDIFKLAGINYETGQTTDESITGKVDDYDYPLLISRLSNDHKDSWRDYIEGGNESFKAWVMVKRKDGDMSWSFEANNISWNDVTKKALDRCDKYIKNKPNSYADNSICVLYYKGAKPTSDNEKILAAETYYGKQKTQNYFNSNLYLLNDKEFFASDNNINLNKDIVSQLKSLKDLLDAGVITQDEFIKLKKKILN